MPPKRTSETAHCCRNDTTGKTPARLRKNRRQCPAPGAKIFFFPKGGTYDLTKSSRPNTGTFGQSSRHVGRDAMDADARRRCVSMRTAKSCGPGPPTLGSSSWTISRATGANKPGTPGRARRKPLKPFACGNAGCSRWTCSDYARVLFSTCTRGCGCIARPAFPTPSLRVQRLITRTRQRRETEAAWLFDISGGQLVRFAGCTSLTTTTCGGALAVTSLR